MGSSLPPFMGSSLPPLLWAVQRIREVLAMQAELGLPMCEIPPLPQRGRPQHPGGGGGAGLGRWPLLERQGQPEGWQGPRDGAGAGELAERGGGLQGLGERWQDGARGAWRAREGGVGGPRWGRRRVGGRGPRCLLLAPPGPFRSFYTSGGHSGGPKSRGGGSAAHTDRASPMDGVADEEEAEQGEEWDVEEGEEEEEVDGDEAWGDGPSGEGLGEGADLQREQGGVLWSLWALPAAGSAQCWPWVPLAHQTQMPLRNAQWGGFHIWRESLRCQRPSGRGRRLSLQPRSSQVQELRPLRQRFRHRQGAGHGLCVCTFSAGTAAEGAAATLCTRRKARKKDLRWCRRTGAR